MGKKLTPLMEQYWEIKSQHQDKILLFRMGDFFEIFYDDAVTAAPLLNIALTSRNKKSGDETPMCGMPHHSVAGPIGKLLAAGHKVAICDQIEDPKLAVGIVKRAVTRILSPGMVYDPDTLDQLSANYLCSYDEKTMSFLEASTGEAFYFRLRRKDDVTKLQAVLSPAEVVLSSQQKSTLLKEIGAAAKTITVHDFEQVPERFQRLPESAKRLVAYAQYMQGPEVLKTLSTFDERQLQKRMEMRPTVLRHLEVFKTYKGEDKGSLFYAINRTKTSAGARLLKSWLNFPLTDVELIVERQDRVQQWVEGLPKLKEVRQVLSGMGDIERRIGKIANPSCHVHDVLALAQALRAGLRVSGYCPGLERHQADTALGIVNDVERTLVDEPPVQTKNGGFVRADFRKDLQELIELSENSQKLLIDLEARERESTGISSLKIKYNNVFGYFLEVTNTHKDKVPDHYKRKQTLANAERYLTQELQELEDKILSSRSKRVEMEQNIFSDLRQKILAATVDLMDLARHWSELDVISSLAWLALEYNYTRPSFSKIQALQLDGSRHPVVEQEVSKPFVPNDIKLGAGECLLLTGPNMAGKSTIMRQVAVTVLLAQMGSYVPARSAVLPIYDQIFTRIGASDFLAEGLSTFMVEMQETAEILRDASENSLVVLDEIGRGTSTYDGMSLAQAILEFLVSECGCMTFFATHYHEITQLDRKYPQIKNAHMAIDESSAHAGQDISFLHTLKEGPANRSYGIQVAQLAGLPKKVTQRAARILTGLESFGVVPSNTDQMSLLDAGDGATYPEAEASPLLDEIREISLPQLTPLEALNQIAKWQKELS